MFARANECGSISQGRLDIRLWYDQIELADMHPELREAPSELCEPLGPAFAHVRLQGGQACAVPRYQDGLPRVVPCPLHETLPGVRVPDEWLLSARRSRLEAFRPVPSLLATA